MDSDVANAASYDSRASFESRFAALWGLRVKHVVQRLIYGALACVGFVSTLLGSRVRRAQSGERGVKHILVVRVDLIGDVVLSLPAVEALHAGYPGASIDMLVLPSTAGVLEAATGINHVRIYDPNIWRNPRSLFSLNNWRSVFALIAGLRATRYDLCLSVAGDWASVLAWLSGARRRVGYSGEAYPGLLTDPVPGRRYSRHEHELTYVHRLARAAGGIVMPYSALPTLRATQLARRAVTSKLGVEPLDNAAAREPLVVVLHVGAQNGSAKRWPALHWAALADQLAHQLGARVVFSGAAGDRPLISAVLAVAHETHTDLCGQTSLAELVALLTVADLVISGDSGPLHIACAVNTQVIGLYGPTDPDLSGPVAPNAIVLRHPVWCAPCYDASATAECRFGNPICMKELLPAAVFEIARRQLALFRAQPNAPSYFKECDSSGEQRSTRLATSDETSSHSV